MHEDLAQLIEQLQAELDQAETLDTTTRVHLQQLVTDIKDSVLDKPSVQERLEQSIGEFEVSHPNMTGFLAKVLETLGSAGV